MSQNTIMLVDDDADILQVIGARCKQLGLRVEHAKNLLTASAMIKKRLPDVLCIDVEMPTGNGLQFCEMLVTDPRTADLPIIVLTGQRDAQTLKACRNLQIEYVAKQNDVWRTLEPLIQTLVAQGPQRRAVALNGIRAQSLPLIPPIPSEAEQSLERAPTKRIIIADDDAELVQLLSQRFSSLGCSVIGASSALEAINAIHRVIPDLVCLDVNMPSGSGLSVCEMMATDAQLRSVPVIILTGCSDETTIRRCHDMLVFYVQKGTNIWSRIEPLVRELLRLDEPAQPQLKLPAAQPGKLEMVSDAVRRPAPLDCNPPDDRDELMDAVFAMLGSADVAQSQSVMQGKETPTEEADLPWALCIDDDQDFSDALKLRLEEFGVAVARAYNGTEGYRMVFTHPASVILLDYNMPNGQGDYVLDRLKSNSLTKDIPVIVISGVKDKMVERRMLAMGAAAFLNKPIDFETLRRQLAKHIDVLSARPVAG